MNDGIPKDLCSLGNVSVDDLVKEMLRLGKGAEMAKVNISQAYRNVPVHPADRHLLGMEWEGRVYVDGMLPYGLRSAPLLFTALGDAMQWSVEHAGVEWLGHYTDNFVTVGRPNAGEGGNNLGVLKDTCAEWGLIGKKRPSHSNHLLGNRGGHGRKEVLRLPQGKVAEMMALVKEWRGMKSCR